ncbi:hypothetical protein [Ruegeria sp. Ofav3-42]|uniref:hypothetical protein n=1 Tax=Ruegeria sp. Ofav3-42 TaxID=2917759 RepID=UPI001EF4E0AE|nr:hypothetical protein [Ruegeria sp. Ofav3-42]MCG7522561.1 hypothetical protein [Ruegeria sp. Ofav3-42]
MAFTTKEFCTSFRRILFASPEKRLARRKGKQLARKKRREADAQVAKDLTQPPKPGRLDLESVPVLL